jgi:N6-adenosine-specific RNA methylase IME4
MTSLLKLDQAYNALMEARTIDELKDLHDKAEALRLYVKQQNQSLEMQNACAELKIRAERRAGELLKEMERDPISKGGKRSVFQPETPKSEYSKAIDDAKLSRSTAYRWQTIAELPEDDFEREIAETKNNSNELTSSRILQKARRFVAKDKPEPPKMEGKYRIVYADPPWKYNDSGLDDYGHAERHYPPMTITELCALPVCELTEDNAVLFLWVTSPLLEECFKVIMAWGFKYKSSFVWDKIKHNFGHYNSVRHEFLLVCTKGSCTPDVQKLYDSVQGIERSETHSEKPREFREIIDTIYPNGSRIELFARDKADRWEVWGNESNLDRVRNTD